MNIEPTKEVLQEMFTYRDGGLYWRVNRSNVSIGARAGTNRSDGYRRIRISKKPYYEHRLIYLFHHGKMPEIIDHIDANSSNNRVENLRPCTKQENGRNSKGWGSTGVKGVYFYKPTQTYQASISVNGAQLYLGRFKTIEEAEAVVMAAREKYHGEFAQHQHKGVTNEQYATS